MRSREYFPALDGLRGIAILMVLLAHNFNRIPYVTELGNYGVDLFFVLSGFLITDILLKTKTEANYLRSFFLRRVLRIFPVYYLVLILFYVLTPLSNNPALEANYTYYSANWPFLAFHLNNLLGFFHPDFPPSRLWAHLWSLSLEEQFYLVWPFFILLVPLTQWLTRWIMIFIFLAIALRIFVWYAYGDQPVFWYAIGSVRFDCLCAGAMLASMRIIYPADFQRRVMQFCFLLLALHALGFLYKFLIDDSFPQFAVFRYSSYAAVCVLVLMVSIKPTGASSFLSGRFLKFFGKISYGLYVYHFPVFILCKIYLLPTLKKHFPGDEQTRVLEGLAASAIAIGLSVVSYLFFEKRFVAMKYRLQTKKAAGN